MLDRIRAIFPAAESFLMDRETLCVHAHFWVRESAPYVGDLSRLNEAEQALYDDIRFNRLGDRIRLEQERIGYACVERAVGQASRPVHAPEAR